MSGAVPWPDHLLSLAEWDALPEDNSRRYELVEGVLQVSPRPVWDHQKVVTRLAIQLDAAGENNPTRLAPDDVLLAVEVNWPGSRRADRVTKPSEYAEAGIPNYWIVDTRRPVVITAFELVDREYKLVTETSTTLSVTVPVPLTVDVRALLP